MSSDGTREARERKIRPGPGVGRGHLAPVVPEAGGTSDHGTVVQGQPRGCVEELSVVPQSGGQLVSQATGQGKLPLFAESETKFFPKKIDAEIEFFKDDNGAVTHLMLRQGPRDIKAPRK